MRVRFHGVTQSQEIALRFRILIAVLKIPIVMTETPALLILVNRAAVYIWETTTVVMGTVFVRQ